MVKVMRTLNQAWPSGAEVAQFEGREMNAGIVRITTSNKDTEISHVDAVPSTYSKMALQLSTNIFLAAPRSGGELEVTRTHARSFEEIASLPSDVDWDKVEGIDHTKGPLLIRPIVGDLVLINTRRPHSTRIFPEDDGPRVSIACFLGSKSMPPPGSDKLDKHWDSPDSKLLCWS